MSVHGDPLAALGGIQSGGQNVYVRELTVALDQMGWQVDVFTHWNDPATPRVQAIGKGSRVIRLAAGRKEFVPKDELFHLLPGFFRELRQGIRHHYSAYRLIHSNYWYSGWVGRQLRKSLTLPQIHVSHSLGLVKAMAARGNDARQALGRRLREERRLLHQADMVVATSPQEREILQHQYGLPAEKTRLIPCGVNPSLFAPRIRAEDRAALKIKDRKIILFVGRLEKNKGLEVLFRAFAQLRAGGESVAGPGNGTELWIAGGTPPGTRVMPGSFELDLRRLAGQLGIESGLRFLGPVSQQKLPVYYSAADVCAIPSFYESFGLVAIEAMACGCPVVASRVGGLAYTVRHDVTGLTVAPRDTEQLAWAMAQILEDEPLREKMSQNASDHVARRFTWPQVTQQMTELYREVTACDSTTASHPSASSWPPTWTEPW